VNKPLAGVVSRGHELLAEVVGPGDLVVDLTAGNGYDTLCLARLAGADGQIIAFDIQPEAIESTRQRLAAAGFSPRLHEGGERPLPRRGGIDLLAAGHELLAEYLPAAPRAVVANLGYLPGGDPRIRTSAEPTLRALQQASRLLAKGGRLVVVVYTGHPGGEEEGAAVSRFFAELDQGSFQVIRFQVLNRTQAPYLLAAEKMPGST
jgi:ubiquinone/menaquinone biosynthesis C-methylase UbiE